MFPKIFQFGKSKPDNWKPGSFSGGIGTSSGASSDPRNAPKQYSKPAYLTESQAQGRRDSEKAKSNTRLSATPGGLGNSGQSASWTDTNSGYDLTH